MKSAPAERVLRPNRQNGKGGIEKGGMKFQGPSVQNEYGALCLFITPLFDPLLFVLATKGYLVFVLPTVLGFV